ncbi:hypothetical protein K0M31_018192 [Melipona bicolor]|uniref:Uncharacterized protein n=1 Tax=Melipona bicolor TaxID=60889 RepID=A0AA40FCV0_9HYME|nr:hypothetical protein K0M31_018192 [Melipona bicolor]
MEMRFLADVWTEQTFAAKTPRLPRNLGGLASSQTRPSCFPKFFSGEERHNGGPSSRMKGHEAEGVCYPKDNAAPRSDYKTSPRG